MQTEEPIKRESQSWIAQPKQINRKLDKSVTSDTCTNGFDFFFFGEGAEKAKHIPFSFVISPTIKPIVIRMIKSRHQLLWDLHNFLAFQISEWLFHDAEWLNSYKD